MLGALSIAAVESRMDEERQFQLAKLLSREAQRLLAQASPGEEARARLSPSPSPDSAAGGTGCILRRQQ